MRLIAVDIGNSACKVGLNFDHRFQPQQTIRWFGEISRSDRDGKTDTDTAIQQLVTALDAESTADSSGCSPVEAIEQKFTWAVCSVHRPRLEQLRNWVQAKRPQDEFIAIETADAPLKIEVEAPLQVGHDRLMAAVAATRYRQSDDQAMVVIDAGTAVTIDLLLPGNRFVGGNIFLGADAEFENISSRTDALPKLDYAFRQQRLEELAARAVEKKRAVEGSQRVSTPDWSPLGRNTIDAILSGVYQPQIGAICHLVAAVAKSIDGPYQVVGTGGGIAELMQLAESYGGEFWQDDWKFDAHLVLAGIAITLENVGRRRLQGDGIGQVSPART